MDKPLIEKPGVLSPEELTKLEIDFNRNVYGIIDFPKLVAKAQRDDTFFKTNKQWVEWLKKRNKYPQCKGLVLTVEDWQALQKLAKEE